MRQLRELAKRNLGVPDYEGTEPENIGKSNRVNRARMWGKPVGAVKRIGAKKNYIPVSLKMLIPLCRRRFKVGFAAAQFACSPKQALFVKKKQLNLDTVTKTSCAQKNLLTF